MYTEMTERSMQISVCGCIEHSDGVVGYYAAGHQAGPHKDPRADL